VKVRIALLGALAVVLLAVAAPAFAVTPQHTIKQLRSQLAAVKKANAKLDTQNNKLVGEYLTTKASLATANASLATTTASLTAATASLATASSSLASTTATVGQLNAQIAAQAAGGAAAVIAGGPDQMWAAITQIWLAFPMEAPGTFCGFDKSNSFFGGTGLNIAHYDFEDDTNC
jgi:hypothetical protein